MKASIITSLFVVLSTFLNVSESAAQEHIEWISFEEAVERSKKEPKKLIIDIYTDWCGWCKKMDRDTYENAKLAEYINDNYYAVKFNAEQREEIEFDGHTFKYVANGRRGVHELAAALTNNKLSYPTTVFMTEKLEIIQPVPGYMDAKSIEPILVYFAEDKFKEVEWPAYQKEYKSFL